MKTVAVIQARHTSSRLPGKMLLPLCNIPVIAHIIARAQSVSEIDQVCVTIPEGEAQRPLADYIGTLDNIHLSRGPEENLLRRFAVAATETKADTVIRLWGDCPAIDPALIQHLLREFHIAKTDWAYLSDDSGYPLGNECQVFDTHVLQAADQEVASAQDKEFVHTYLEKNEVRFSCRKVYRDRMPSKQVNRPQLLLDTATDYSNLCQIFEALYLTSPVFGVSNVERFAKVRPELFQSTS